MQDSYLFRGKRIDNGEWIQGSFVDGDVCIAKSNFICPWVNTYECLDIGDEALIPENKNAISIGRFYEVDPDTVSQYTGRTDDTGRLIFEGDIYNQPEREIDYIVTWADELMMFVGVSTVDAEWEELYGMLKEAVYLGNCWDNDELLEGSHCYDENPKYDTTKE